MLRHREHEVYVLTDLIAPDSPDVSVAQLAIANSAILLTHDNDFKSQQTQAGKAEREAFTKVHLVLICNLSRSTLQRFAQVIDLLEWEVAGALERGERPYLHILKDKVVIYR